jgi:dipeptidyl aminopeptidase/acylaminoacyl peptidase
MRRPSLVLLFAFAFIFPALSRAQSAQSAQSAPAAHSSQAEQPGQATRPMTFQDMMQMKRLGETAVSPDGKWLAYSVTTVNLKQNTKTPELWLQAIAPSSEKSSEPIKIAVGQAGDAGPEFAPDGHSVLFLSGRENGQQIWVADFDPATGATSNAKKLTAIATEADNAKWSPDGHSVVFTSGVYPDCPPITTADFGTGNKCNADRDKALADSKVKAQIWTHLMYRHWDHYTGDKRFHLFQVLVESGGMRDLNPGETHDVPPEVPTEPLGCGCDISPDGKEIAFTEKLVDDDAISTNSDIFTLDLTDPKAKPVKVSTSPGGDLNPAYSSDGKYLAWRSQARAGYEADKFRLVVYDRAAKTIKEMMPGFNQWVDEFTWDPRSFAIHVASSYQSETQLLTVDIPQGSYIAMGATEGEFSDLKLSADGLFLFATAMHVTAPSEVVIFDLRSVHLNSDPSRTLGSLGHAINPERHYDSAIVFNEYALTHLNDALLAQLDLPKMESFWFTAKDGTKLEGFIIRPPEFDAQKKYPVKFLIHGGPQGNWGDDWSYRWNAELFAANGYVVVMINMRGSTGYGQAIVDGVNGDWGGKPFTDLMEGLDYAEEHFPFIDKTRECALGASYGGYMANWVLGHTDRFKCIVSHDGMFNAESAFGSTEEDWFNIWEFKGHPWDYYGRPDSENPYRKWSPMLYATHFKTPTLVVHGQLDYRLDVSEGLQLFDTLQMLGVPSKMLYFPNEGHWVLKPQDAQLWWKAVNDWVDEWTRKAGSSQ